jgi:small subunit ribosomal protein S6
MNIECNDKALDEINHNFRFNESVLHHLVLKRDTAQKEPSPIFRSLQAQETPSTNAASQIPEAIEAVE